jgi:hypothetical protein
VLENAAASQGPVVIKGLQQYLEKVVSNPPSPSSPSRFITPPVDRKFDAIKFFLV